MDPRGNPEASGVGQGGELVQGIGDLFVGDLNGKVWIETASGDVKIGRVSEATLKAVGSGDIQIGAVSGPLELNVAGSGGVKCPTISA